jgi:hypothetical protein
MALYATLAAPLLVFVVYLAFNCVLFGFLRAEANTAILTRLMILCTPLLYPAYRLSQHLFAGWTGQALPLALFTFLLFTLLWCGYFESFSAFDTSPSLRYLIELLEAEGRPLTPKELKARFDFDDVYRRRVERMASGGGLIVEGSGDKARYRNSPKGTFLGVVVGHLKSFMNLGKGG